MSEKLRQIADKVWQMSGVGRWEGEAAEDTILRGLEELERTTQEQLLQHESNSRRVAAILEVVMSLAQLDYTKKAAISASADYIDALAAGINMLGEELKGSTISLNEKEVMLKEIHHRVKNNLQIISSLLNLQAEQTDDPLFREKHRVSRDRIRSMALVHEKLYESKNLSQIDFGDYVDTLARSLNFSYNPDSSRIAVSFDITEGAGLFRIETAIPCGLILNEMLSNSFKYAFPGERKGNVHVYFGKDANDEKLFRLEVKDDGIGLDENLDPANSETLGFQLITLLAEQVDGKLEVERKKGTRVALVFAEGK